MILACDAIIQSEISAYVQYFVEERHKERDERKESLFLSMRETENREKTPTDTLCYPVAMVI